MAKQDNTILILLGVGALLLFGGFVGVKSLVNPTAAEDKKQDLTRRNLLKDLRIILGAGYQQTLRAKYGLILPMLNPLKLSDLAAKINKSIGIFSDDEAAIYAAFQALNSKFEANALAQTYSNKFGRDLFATLADNLNQEEVTYIASIVDNLKTK